MNITCNDLICMMLQIGLSDQNLQRELGAIRNPTLDTFSEKIEGFEQAKRTVVLRQLTGKGRPFLWLPEHQVEFDKLKAILSSDLIVRHFDHTKPVYLLPDASRLFGLGYALGHIEKDHAGKDIFKIVHCGSKSLTPTQQCYSTIELKCLAIV